LSGRGHLVVHEHQRLVVPSKGHPPSPWEVEIDEAQWEALARYAEHARTPPFRVGHRSITLGHHVGYLQIGKLRLEVLPKLRRAGEGNWRGLLLHMLREVLGLRITVQQASPLGSHAGSVFDVLVEHFLHLVDALLREGLACAYREVEGNETCLRGRLVVDRHLRVNVGHDERLYVAYPVFDADTLPNRILHRALVRVRQSTPDDALRCSAEALLGAFPDTMPGRVRRADFGRLVLDRRTLRYAEALELARLLLFDERPDLRWGGAPVVSLLFDMNALFEAYVLHQIRRLPGFHVRAQARQVFWRSAGAGRKSLKPDLVVTSEHGEALIIDTKWKIPEGGRPGDDDLRQMFAYLELFAGKRGLLLYPRADAGQVHVSGNYSVHGLACSTAFLDLLRDGEPDAALARDSLRSLLAGTVGEDTARPCEALGPAVEIELNDEVVSCPAKWTGLAATPAIALS